MTSGRLGAVARPDDELPEIEVVGVNHEGRAEVEVKPDSARSRTPWVIGVVVAVAVLAAVGQTFRTDRTLPEQQEHRNTTPTPTDSGDAADTDEPSETPVPGPVRGQWQTLPSTLTENSEPSPFMASVDDDRVLVLYTENGGENVAGEILDLRRGTAEPIADSPLRWRASAMVGWTGRELIVVGGSNGPGIDIAGAAYYPETDAWQQIADPPGFEPGLSDNQAIGPAVWTGDELISWQSELAYNPTTNTWRRIAPSPLAPRAGEAVAATSRGVLVWGGCDTPGKCLSDGALYDPVGDEWTVLPDGPLGRGTEAFAVDTGLADRAVIIVPYSTTADVPPVAALDLSALQWHEIDGLPQAAQAISVVWTGTHVIVWAGPIEEDKPGAAFMFNPALNQWRSIPPDGTTRHAFAALWTPHGLLIAGGSPSAQPALFTPASGTLCPGQYRPPDRAVPSPDGLLPELGATTYDNVADTVLINAQDIADRYPGTVDITVGPGWGVAYEDNNGEIEIHQDLNDHIITVHLADATLCTYTGPAFYPGPDGRSVPIRFVVESP